MTNPADAYHNLLLSLAQRQLAAVLVPDSLACTLAADPDFEGWQISLRIQPVPLALVVQALLPLHLNPMESDYDAILRRCNDLNRVPQAAAFSFDTLGGVAAFRFWLPLDPGPRSFPALVLLALDLAAQAARTGGRALQPDTFALTDDSASPANEPPFALGDDRQMPC